jgi:hypothetical protein
MLLELEINWSFWSSCVNEVGLFLIKCGGGGKQLFMNDKL